ncbi:MAG: hypothetical protein A2664_03030 [Candidatus Taylorbacteria bacterium RIFCSPHIGHO2_01_FULL_46_22b]|uniref:Helix-turn-helix domain-containing protein n=1 Tax=Candidatus Taylorbacteria bacterium RIFCSPHIGHO2_01_FULL_46_22b TaxID=1802301 RepID=A0A1G2M3Y8_9BACT|nr:MAG: hypothetical protein A2664_03030 [Candidatus Taylorbacteria bacterium RIFCSPHIGHO2_01_FULL_46_22b]
MELKLKLRFKRNNGWFFIHNREAERIGNAFGAIGLAVYIFLCRRSDLKTQKCHPSQKRTGKDIQKSAKCVQKYIRLFQEARIIGIERGKHGGRWLNNTYTLIDMSEWLIPEEISSSGKSKDSRSPPEENNAANQGQYIPRKETLINKENNVCKKENQELIEGRRKLAQKWRTS